MSRIVIKGGSEAAAGDCVLRRPEPNNLDMIKFRLLTPGETAPRRAHSSSRYFLSMPVSMPAHYILRSGWVFPPAYFEWQP